MALFYGCGHGTKGSGCCDAWRNIRACKRGADGSCSPHPLIKGIALLCILLCAPTGQVSATSFRKAGQGRGDPAFKSPEVARREKARQWETRIVLPLPDDQCLAYERFTGSCLLNAMEFNRSVNPQIRRDIPDSVSRLSREDVFRTRKTILDGLWEEIFTRNLLNSRLDQPLQAEIDSAWSKQVAESARGLGLPSLHRLYAQHYNALFAARRDVEVQLLGASDSLFLDSLPRLPANPQPPLPGKARLAREDSAASREPGYSWQSFRAKDLPEELGNWAKTAAVGAQSPILRTESGWFILRVSKSTPVPAKSFSQALPALLAIAALPEDPREYQDAGQPAPAEGDNREIRFWLLPEAKLHGRSARMPAWADTVRLAPMRTRFSRLPETVRERAAVLLSRSGSRILKSAYGIWYFKPATEVARAPSLADTRGRREPAVPSAQPLEPSLRLALENAAQSEREFRSDFLRSRIADSCSTDSAFRLSQLPGSGTPRVSADPFTFVSKKWVEQNVAIQEDLLKP
jgi:hypothetical protein